MNKPIPAIPFEPRSDKNRYFNTGSLYLAAYLYAHGLWLSNAERNPSGRYRFAFRDTGELDTLVRQFQKGAKALVDARTYMCAIEELKRRVDQIGGNVNLD